SMNARFTIVLVVLLILVGGLVGVTQVLRSDDDPPERGDRLYRVSSSELSDVTISQDDEKITFVSLDEQWYIKDEEQGENLSVNIDRWGGIPSLLGGPAVSTNLSESEEELGDRASYGIEPPRSRINLTTFNGLGIEVNIGDLTPTQDGYYAQVTGSEILYIVHSSWVDVLMRLLTEPPYPL
ncbi:MAG: DUF4340 domain-containing protein, partial [Dehalococcoidia bacterium]